MENVGGRISVMNCHALLTLTSQVTLQQIEALGVAEKPQKEEALKLISAITEYLNTGSINGVNDYTSYSKPVDHFSLISIGAGKYNDTSIKDPAYVEKNLLKMDVVRNTDKTKVLSVVFMNPSLVTSGVSPTNFEKAIPKILGEQPKQLMHIS